MTTGYQPTKETVGPNAPASLSVSGAAQSGGFVSAVVLRAHVQVANRPFDPARFAGATDRQHRRNVSITTFARAPLGHPADPRSGIAPNVGGNTVAYSNSTQNTEQHRCNAV
jgi:hypothetical protein